MSCSTNSYVSRWGHIWTEEGIALCTSIIKEKDQLYFNQLLATKTAAKIKADVKEILEPMWSTQKKKAYLPKPTLKQLLPFTKPVPKPAVSQSFAPSKAPASFAKVNTTRPCCVGCKKFQIHPNPPPHFTPEDMAHCCALCRLSSGKRHGDHCSKQKA